MGGQIMKLGEIIDERYKVRSLLGEGGMAQVYLADDLIARKEVAIKIIKEDTMKNPVNLTRFEREARAAASLNHQNIVRVLNLGTFEGRPYMVNELIKGQNLRDILNVRGKFSVLEACDIMYQLCSAVLHAHQHGVIHRDIKPQNVYLTADSTIKLGDFGIATFQNASRVTRSEVVIGSVHYLAPEISQGNPASPQSDIYALGITFFELLTGKVPFDDESPVTVALKHIKDKLPSVRKLNPKVPAVVEKIIYKACEKNPNNRYKSVFDMRKDIDRILRDPDSIQRKSFWERLFGRKNKD
jgi:serine/threonine-protein kinase